MVSRIKPLFQALNQYWGALRSRYWLALSFDVVLIVAIFIGISHWQSQHLLAADGQQSAPNFTLTAVDGTVHQLSDARGKTALVYFFAPWCHVCELSAGNIEALRRAREEEDLAIYMVALSYDSVADVETFAEKHELSVPVLLGSARQMLDYRIRGFPTYYVISPDGSLKNRAVGYSTQIGLRWRTI